MVRRRSLAEWAWRVCALSAWRAAPALPPGSPSAEETPPARAPSCSTSSRASALEPPCTVMSMWSAPLSCAVSSRRVRCLLTSRSASRTDLSRLRRRRRSSSAMTVVEAETASSKRAGTVGGAGSVRVRQRRAGRSSSARPRSSRNVPEPRTKPRHHGGQPGESDQARTSASAAGPKPRGPEHEGLGSVGRGGLLLCTEPHRRSCTPLVGHSAATARAWAPGRGVGGTPRGRRASRVRPWRPPVGDGLGDLRQRAGRPASSGLAGRGELLLVDPGQPAAQTPRAPRPTSIASCSGCRRRQSGASTRWHGRRISSSRMASRRVSSPAQVGGRGRREWINTSRRAPAVPAPAAHSARLHAAPAPGLGSWRAGVGWASRARSSASCPQHRPAPPRRNLSRRTRPRTNTRVGRGRAPARARGGPGMGNAHSGWRIEVHTVGTGVCRAVASGLSRLIGPVVVGRGGVPVSGGGGPGQPAVGVGVDVPASAWVLSRWWWVQ